MAGPRGFDGTKKVDGIKRHIRVDTAGILVAAVVTSADMADRAAFPALLRKATTIAPTIAHVWPDKGYTGQTVAEAPARTGVSIEIVSGPNPPTGSGSSHTAGSSNAPTAGSTTAGASTTTTKPPSRHTRAS